MPCVRSRANIRRSSFRNSTEPDRALHRAEFRAARNAKFNLADRSENEIISRSEDEIVVARFCTLHGLDHNDEQGTQNIVFDRVDVDGDDRVTRDEFNEAADRMFVRLDADADELLTVEDGFGG